MKRLPCLLIVLFLFTGSSAEARTRTQRPNVTLASPSPRAISVQAGGASFFTIPPCRLLDTRVTPPAITTTPRTIPVTGSCGVPFGATAIAGNLTAVDPPVIGFLKLYPRGTNPATSTLNFRAGQTRANNFVMPLSTAGQVNLVADTTVQAVIDVSGYFASTDALQATISADEPNFHLAGTYAGSVAKTPDVFSIFATAGLDRYIFQGGQWVDAVTPNCPADPRQITDPRCGDAHFLMWKHVACSDWYVPCATNNRYNAYAGINNHQTDPDPANWPPPGMTRRISAQTLAAVLPYLPAGTEASCRPGNPGAFPNGAAMPKVVHIPSIDRYLMMFNGIVHTNLGGAADTWRVLWAHSTDAASWTILPNYLLRSSWEASECEAGFQVQDLDYENGYLYALIGSIDHPIEGVGFPRPTSNRYYMFRAPIASTSPHYGQWQIASGIDLYGNYTWSAIPPSGLVNAESAGYALFNGEQAYSTSAAMGKVYASPGGAWRWIFATRRQYDAGINLWSSASLEQAPRFESIVSNQTGLNPSQYGWIFSFSKAGRSLPATDIDLATPSAFWVVAWTTTGSVQNKVDYRKVRLSLCGRAPFGPC